MCVCVKLNRFIVCVSVCVCMQVSVFDGAIS